MFKNHVPGLLAGCLLFSSFSYAPLRADGYANAAKICAAGAVAFAGIGSIFGLCSWLFNESDEKLLRNIQSEYKQLSDDYTSMVHTLEEWYQVHKITARERNRIITDVNEALLYSWANRARDTKQAMSYISDRLSSKVSSLRSRNAKLVQRLNELRAKARGNYEALRMLSEMEQLIETIDQDLPRFELLRDYLAQHRGYFVIYETEDAIRKQYERELQVITDYPDNWAYIRREVKRVVVNKGGKYPYVSYAEQLERDIKKIQEVIRRAGYKYSDRLHCARWVGESLAYIKGIVVSEPAYTDEIRMRERERVEKEHGLN